MPARTAPPVRPAQPAVASGGRWAPAAGDLVPAVYIEPRTDHPDACVPDETVALTRLRVPRLSLGVHTCAHHRRPPPCTHRTGQNRFTMKYVVYGLTSVLTSSAAASAVMRYAVAVGRAGTSDLVAIPAVDIAGVPIAVEVLLGPGVPVLAEPAADDLLEPEHQEFVDELAERTRVLTGRPSERA